jgi:hypothetical protein
MSRERDIKRDWEREREKERENIHPFQKQTI